MNAPQLPPDFPAHITPPAKIGGHAITKIQVYTGIRAPAPPKGLRWIVWALFGNELDGPIGDKEWNPERKDTWRIRVKWWGRNPFHNLFWHVLGFAHETTIRYDARLEDGQGWNRAWTERADHPGKRYPFWLYLGRHVEFYFGWRARGAFGMKLKRRREQ